MNKVNILTVFFLVVICCASHGQDKSGKSNISPVSYSVFAGVGKSLFKSNIDGPTKFVTPELRLGGSMSWLLNEHFEINSRIVLGLKIKRERDNKPGQPYIYSGPYITQDEMASRNHYFVEIPMIFQYRFLHPQINLGAGISYRQFFNKDYSYPVFDPLSGKKEIGVIGRIAYRLNGKISIGFEQYFALNKLYTSSGIIDGEDVSLSVKNRFTQITFEYRLK